MFGWGLLLWAGLGLRLRVRTMTGTLRRLLACTFDIAHPCSVQNTTHFSVVPLAMKPLGFNLSWSVEALKLLLLLIDLWLNDPWLFSCILIYLYLVKCCLFCDLLLLFKSPRGQIKLLPLLFFQLGWCIYIVLVFLGLELGHSGCSSLTSIYRNKCVFSQTTPCCPLSRPPLTTVSLRICMQSHRRFQSIHPTCCY